MSVLSLVKSAPVTGTIPFPQALNLRQGKYVARLADNTEEIDAVLRLRFAIFNIELGQGLAQSFASGKEEDLFDHRSEHVLIIEQISNQIVGTCRLRSNDDNNGDSQFFSSERFNLTTLPQSVIANAVEFGRACIVKSHRNKDSVKLLWSFLSEYTQRRGKQYLIGCCSMQSQDPLAGGQLFEWLANSGHVHPDFKVIPKPGSKCIFYKTQMIRSARVLPSSLHSYLKYGAKVCGLPAIDRNFRTIDFFTPLDLEVANPKRTQLLSRAS
jgi:putative hemolysin